MIKPSQPIPLENDNNPRVLPILILQQLGDEKPIRTLRDYSKPSHKGYRNTTELPVGNNVDLTLYDNESWNDPRDFAKPIKAITLPQNVLSTPDRRLIKLENQVQRLTEAHLALTQPTQVTKVTTLCEIYSGPHDTQYCMEDPEQAFVEYASSRTDEARGFLNHSHTNSMILISDVKVPVAVVGIITTGLDERRVLGGKSPTLGTGSGVKVEKPVGGESSLPIVMPRKRRKWFDNYKLGFERD
nr:MAK10-like protein [Tanacetum cinerariifolium]